MKFLLPIYFLVTCTATTLHAQVRELWRSGITNSVWPCFPSPCPTLTNFSTTSAAMDLAGNTFVGGTVQIAQRPYAPLAFFAFIAKFDARGAEQWKFGFGTKEVNGVDSLAVDEHGCVYFTTRPTLWEDPNPAVLFKLSPDGSELWRAEEDYAAPGATAQSASSSVKLDPHGNVYFLVATYRETTPGGYESKRIVAKFDPAGRRRWRMRPRGQPQAVPRAD